MIAIPTQRRTNALDVSRGLSDQYAAGKGGADCKRDALQNNTNFVSPTPTLFARLFCKRTLRACAALRLTELENRVTALPEEVPNLSHRCQKWGTSVGGSYPVRKGD